MINTPQSNFSRYQKYATDLRRYYRMPTVQTSLTAVLSFFIAAFFIFVALRPTFVTITTLKKTITESKKTLTLLEQKATALQKISTASDKYTPLIRYVDNAIPVTGPQYQDVTTALEFLASESSVTLSATTLGDALTYSSIIDPYSGTNRTVISMPLTVQVNGTFVTINDFFTKLTSIDRLITVDSIAFNRETKSRKTTTDTSNLISVTFSGKVHYMANQSLLTPILPSIKNQTRSSGQTQEVSDVPEK